MLREGYELTAVHEARHWWFSSRRELFLRQVARSAAAIEARRDTRERLQILDYGCGTGFNLPYLARYGRAVGCDVADLALGEFGKSADHPRLDLKQDLSQHHGKFQIVTALDVLEHCDDDVAALQAMGRFLATPGQLILTVPAYAWLWSGEDVISQHRRRYTKKSLLQACERAGFSPLYVSYFNLSILPAMASVIWSRRVLDRATLQRSNLGPTAPWLNAGLQALTTLEARVVGGERLALPAGASLVARLIRT
jgi:SAM-dependent methyltransferase